MQLRLEDKNNSVLRMLLLMAGAWRAGAEELGLARMALAAVGRLEKRAADWAPGMEPAWWEPVWARASGSEWAMLRPRPRRGRPAA